VPPILNLGHSSVCRPSKEQHRTVTLYTGAERTPGKGHILSTKSYTVTELAEAERVSRAFMYKLWSQGQGPRFYMVGNRRRITEEQRQEWHREREASSNREGR
jgi:excisionase family DNA binding protein